MDSPHGAPAREHGLDALRVFAFALLILYHSCLAYVSWPWLINDPGGGRALESILMGMNRWRLPLLFFVSGAAAALALTVAVLGILSWHASSAVLRAGRVVPARAAALAGRQADLTSTLDERMSRLTSRAGLGRDPFRPPAEPAPAARPSPAGPAPVLRALLYDEVDPSVQLAMGGSTSSWLHRGGSWRGWSVVEIGRGGATIQQAGRRVHLSSP